MKKAEYYAYPIPITDSFAIVFDPSKEFVNFYEGGRCVDRFATNRKIYTLFKEIQARLQSPNYLTIENNQGDLYSGEIHLDEKILMQVTNIHGCLTLDFYQKKEEGLELLYLTPLTYTTKTLFKNMTIPYRLLTEPNFRVKHVFKFLDMMLILNQKNAYER